MHFSNGKSNILIETLSTNICILSSWLSMVAAFSEIYSVFYSPPSSSLNPPYILATGNLFPAFFSSLSSFFSRPRTALVWLLFCVWALFVNWFQRDPRYVSVIGCSFQKGRGILMFIDWVWWKFSRILSSDCVVCWFFSGEGYGDVSKGIDSGSLIWVLDHLSLFFYCFARGEHTDSVMSDYFSGPLERSNKPGEFSLIEFFFLC